MWNSEIMLLWITFRLDLEISHCDADSLRVCLCHTLEGNYVRFNKNFQPTQATTCQDRHLQKLTWFKHGSWTSTSQKEDLPNLEILMFVQILGFQLSKYQHGHTLLWSSSHLQLSSWNMMRLPPCSTAHRRCHAPAWTHGLSSGVSWFP